MTGDELMDMARDLNGRGEAYALVTVVRAVAPTSAYLGAQAIVLAANFSKLVNRTISRSCSSSQTTMRRSRSSQQLPADGQWASAAFWPAG